MLAEMQVIYPMSVSMIATPLKSFTTLRFSGAKTKEFLQGQVTCDIRALKRHGDASLAACCDHRGRMIANFWVVQYHDDVLFILPSSVADTVKTHLQKFAMFSKVTIQIDAQFYIAEAFDAFNLHEHHHDTVFITLPTANRFLVLAQSNPFSDVTPNEEESLWRLHNVHDHLCVLYPETSLLFTPHMISLEKLGGVSFQKGCYVGQEIVARTEYLGKTKRHIHQQTLLTDHPIQPGDPLKNIKDETIGVIVEAVKQPDNTYAILAVAQDT